MLTTLLYAVLLGGLAVGVMAAINALREAIRQRARFRGIAFTVLVALLALVGIWAILV